MDLTDEQKARLIEAQNRIDAEHAKSKKKDRVALMGDIIKQQRRRGFKGDTKIRWRLDGAANLWPWAQDFWKPKDQLRNLVRAGALIAAAIDRLQDEQE